MLMAMRTLSQEPVLLTQSVHNNNPKYTGLNIT